MNISFNTQSPYSFFYQKPPLMGQNAQQKPAGMSVTQNMGFSMPSMQVSASPSIDIQA